MRVFQGKTLAWRNDITMRYCLFAGIIAREFIAISKDRRNSMSNPVEKGFNLGGSIEKALSGDYELKPAEVIKEAWQLTIRHFLSFSPAVVLLIVIQAVIFVIAMQLQVGGLDTLFGMFANPETMDPSVFQAIFVANLSYEVISAPIYAGVALMAMSHAAGLKTRTGHITKGLPYMIPVFMVTLLSLVIQTIGGTILPILSIYVSIAFSHSVLLVCEKRIPPLRALYYSFKAVNKRLIAVAAVYIVSTIFFALGVMMYGLGLIIAVPFFFHAKGIIYRNAFGIRLQVVSVSKPSSDDNQDDTPNNPPASGSDTFDA